MEAKELRLGNLVKFVGVVRSADVDFINCLVKQESVGFDTSKNYKPIELTEEDWFIDFGFKEYDGRFFIEIGRKAFIVSPAQDGDYTLMYREDVGLPFHFLVFINFVHELQNLIFALTGQELTLR